MRSLFVFPPEHRQFTDPLDWRNLLPPRPSSTPEACGPGLSKNRKCMRRKMKGTWQAEPNFFDKYFGNKGQAVVHAQSIKACLYNENAKVRRWKRIPAKPKSALKLIAPLQNLLNAILEQADIPLSRRRFLKPNPAKIKVSRAPLSAPDLLLAGIGSAFVANTRKCLEAEYSCAMVPVRIMLESEFRYKDRHLSAAHANEIFFEQDNRRFVYAVILTELYLRMFMFDPSGAVVSPRMDYHARPGEFCAVMAGIASLDEVRAGFDASFLLDDASVPRIWTMERTVDSPARPVSYRVQSRLFRASRFIGRLTGCWLVELDGEPDKKYVIKDAWVATNEMQKDKEGCLIRHANKQGVVCGLVRIRHEVQMQVPGRNTDTTVKNRRIRRGAFADDMTRVQDRVHTRIVMETYGKPLWKFSSRRELLLAFYDAVRAHSNLYHMAGILHRDVSLGNILINPGGEEGDRGVLIDLDYATRLEHVAKGYKSVGTYKYMSRNLLRSRQVHSHLDDLESFYYVLCWLICEYGGPGDVAGSRVDKTPELLEPWIDGNEDVAWEAKRKHLRCSFELPVTPWFGGTIRELAVRLHSFFQRREKPGEPAQDVSQDYEEFIGHIADAVDSLLPEDAVVTFTQPSLTEVGPEPPVSRKRKAEDIAAIPDEPKPKRAALAADSTAQCIAVNRTRRSKATYARYYVTTPQHRRGY